MRLAVSILFSDKSKIYAAQTALASHFLSFAQGYTSIKEEVDFLERICAIEKHFDVHFDLSGKITDEAYQLVIQISELVMNDKVEFTWKNTEFTGIVSEHFKSTLGNLERSFSMLTYVGIIDVKMFGIKLSIRFQKTYREALIVDTEKIRKVLELSDVGDPIKIKLKPGKDNTGFDTLNISESLLEADDRFRAGLPLPN